MGQLSMDFELTQLVLSSSGQYLWIRRDLVTNVLYDGQCSSCMTEPFFPEYCWQRQKTWGVYSFTGQGAISQKRNDVCNKCSIRHLSTLKTVNLEYCSSHSVAWMIRWHIPSGCVYPRGASILCFVFCNRSQLWLSTASYCIWSTDHTPFCIQ